MKLEFSQEARLIQQIGRWLTPPHTLNSTYAYRSRFLQASLWATTVACLLFAGLNYSGEFSQIVQVFLAISALSLLGLWLNQHGHYSLAAALLLVMVFAGLNFNLYDGGALHDPGIAAYPIFILMCGFLFGRVSVPPALILNLVSLAWIFYGTRLGWMESANFPSVNRTLILVILCGVTAVVSWVLIEAWEKTVDNIRATYEQTLSGWAKALELRDQETEGHSRRVTELAVALAQTLGLRNEALEAVRQGAILHDIGKMGIPDAILLKPGPLTEPELEIVKTHPALAAELLQQIPYLNLALDIPRYHHERWDGNGYPNGLEGEHIPLVARLFSVVDNWDALNSDRPYRPAWPRAEVVQYLQENAGVKFDPFIVTVFLAMMQERQTGNVAETPR